MTFSQYRRFGHISKLSRIVCGPSSTETAAENEQIAVSQEQLATANQQSVLQSQNAAAALKLQQPAIDQETALATGDPKAVLAAAMPTISTLSAQFSAAQEAIENQIPPGPARDAALANLQTSKASTQAGTEAQLVQNAPGVLANIGSGLGAFSLQELGASLSGLSGANTSAGGIASEENASQANKVGLLSSVVGAAGKVGAAAIP
jgi:hypothetical protein